MDSSRSKRQVKRGRGTMPSAAVNGQEKAPVTDLLEPFRQTLTLMEHKIRNMEKRKLKLDSYKNEQDLGKSLNSDQLTAVAKYGEVSSSLEFARDLFKQVSQIQLDTARQLKKQQKRDQMEKAALELARAKQMLVFSGLCQKLAIPKVRDDFANGANGAFVIDGEDLKALDELSFSGLHCKSSAIANQLDLAAEQMLNLIDGKPKAVSSNTTKTYKELKDILTSLSDCDYFDPSRVFETETEPDAEGEEEEEEEEDEEETAAVEGEEKENEPEKEEDVRETTPPKSKAQEVLLPPPPVIGSVSDCANILAEKTSYSFIQESQIDIESPHMDPAVVAVSSVAPPPLDSRAQVHNMSLSYNSLVPTISAAPMMMQQGVHPPGPTEQEKQMFAAMQYQLNPLFNAQEQRMMNMSSPPGHMGNIPHAHAPGQQMPSQANAGQSILTQLTQQTIPQQQHVIQQAPANHEQVMQQQQGVVNEEQAMQQALANQQAIQQHQAALQAAIINHASQQSYFAPRSSSPQQQELANQVNQQLVNQLANQHLASQQILNQQIANHQLLANQQTPQQTPSTSNQQKQQLANAYVQTTPPKPAKSCSAVLPTSIQTTTISSSTPVQAHVSVNSRPLSPLSQQTLDASSYVARLAAGGIAVGPPVRTPARHLRNLRGETNASSFGERPLLTEMSKAFDAVRNYSKPGAPGDSILAPSRTEVSSRNEVQAPRNEVTAPRNEVQAPRNEVQAPRNESHAPRNESHAPRNESHAPRNESNTPRNEAHAPHNEMHAPRNDMHTPRNEMHASRNEVHSSHSEMRSSHEMHPSRNEMYSSRNEMHSSRNEDYNENGEFEDWEHETSQESMYDSTSEADRSGGGDYYNRSMQVIGSSSGEQVGRQSSSGQYRQNDNYRPRRPEIPGRGGHAGSNAPVGNGNPTSRLPMSNGATSFPVRVRPGPGHWGPLDLDDYTLEDIGYGYRAQYRPRNRNRDGGREGPNSGYSGRDGQSNSFGREREHGGFARGGSTSVSGPYSRNSGAGTPGGRGGGHQRTYRGSGPNSGVNAY